ncbi:hypothetical protein [Aeromicrobium sp. CF3.5]|uniref:hypothetical protein n=1 Tax=Aeromicrobium sp. CF3.5 TaxID=3373078 RepID=UPI003EE76322
METPSVVCAAGAWSSTIGTWVGVDLPVRPPAPPDRGDRAGGRTGSGDPVDDRLLSTSFYFHHEGRGLLIGKHESEDVWDHDLSPSPGQPG